jgi:lipoprotein NlpD
MFARLSRAVLAVASLAATVSFVGCASGGGRAPVEDRSVGGRAPAAATPGASPAPAVPVRIGQAPENAGRPGYYSVKPGDTLARIALDHGQNWRDVARWNNIDNPNVIEVGQVLRVWPPGAETAAVAQPVAAPNAVQTRPIEGRPDVPAAAPAAAAAPSSPAPAAGSTAAAGAPAAPATPPAREGDEDVNWLWPATGPVLANFDEGRNVKGLAIGGKAGDPVLAAADGRVVYAGSGLRGYGNLVIVKHNSTYLTAYAHNQTLLVREDQAVRRGQKIAEMGSSDTERVQLHFEIRRMGKPIDPSRLLPPR